MDEAYLVFSFLCGLTSENLGSCMNVRQGFITSVFSAALLCLQVPVKFRGRLLLSISEQHSSFLLPNNVWLRQRSLDAEAKSRGTFTKETICPICDWAPGQKDAHTVRQARGANRTGGLGRDVSVSPKPIA